MNFCLFLQITVISTFPLDSGCQDPSTLVSAKCVFCPGGRRQELNVGFLPISYLPKNNSRRDYLAPVCFLPKIVLTPLTLFPDSCRTLLWIRKTRLSLLKTLLSIKKPVIANRKPWHSKLFSLLLVQVTILKLK